MSIQTEYESQKLDDMSLIGGTDYTLEFPILTPTGNSVDISSASMKWLLCPYGEQSYPILEKSAETSGSATFIVNLTSLDTLYLDGIYLQQIEITNSSGSKIRPAEGVILIKKAIPVQ